MSFDQVIPTRERASRMCVRLRAMAAAAAIAGLTLPTVAAEQGAGDAFAVLRTAFEKIRSDYVDDIDEPKLLSAAGDGMIASRRSDGRLVITILGRRPPPPGSIEEVEQTFRAIQKNYRGPVGDRERIDAAIAAMMQALDRHSQYLDAETFRQQRAPPQLGSVGLNLTMKDGVATVVSPIENAPAARAGILAGDTLVAIDGAPVAGLALAQVVGRLRGPPQSDVVLTISVQGRSKPIDIPMKRATIHQPSVHARAFENIGYIAVTRFTGQTDADVRAAIARLQAAPAADELIGIIVDLRDNAGGLLDGAVAMTRLFLARGLIATTTARGRETQRLEASSGDLTNGKPIVVLINERTAAGAEIVAGALQQHRRATIVGAKSAGAGTIQTIIPLGDGQGALRLTTSRVQLASGRLIEGNGIDPDIVETQPKNPSQDVQLQVALNVLRRGGQ